MASKRKMRCVSITALYYLVLIALGAVLIFPLIYMFLASFKTNAEIFGQPLKMLPDHFTLEGYINGWKGVGNYTFGTYMGNSFLLTLPTTFLTIASSLFVAYGFARFDFPLKKLLFSMMYGLMLLPASVLIIPRYLVFARLKWVDTYLPFWIPAAMATSSFFIYMFIQFFRGLPLELDEAAMIDGCSSLGILRHILLPLCMPAIISAAIFSFIWTWNDFMAQFIYISSVSKYTVSLGLRMCIEGTANINWANVLAMSIVSIIPSMLVYLLLQKYFVEGIATSGLKG
jgi:oligogalacturonide transport system permease protein